VSAARSAIDKLGARSISISEVREVPWNRPVMIRNPAAHTTDRRLLLGKTTAAAA
jgi:hypothetical protein